MTVKQAQEELATSPQLPGYGRGILHEAGRGAMIGAFGGGMYGLGAGAGILKFAPTPHMVHDPAGYLGRMTAAGALVGAVPGVLGGAIAGGIRTAQERRRLQSAVAAQQQAAKQAAYESAKLAQEKEAAQNLPGYGRGILQGAAIGALASGIPAAALGGTVHSPDFSRAGMATVLGGAAALPGAAIGGLAGLGITALERRRLQNAAAAQQAKQAGITDYIPGWTNLNRAHLTHIDAQGLAAANKGINSPFLQDMVDKKRVAAIKELGIGGAKLLGTGLAVGGAAYGAKKLYNRMTDNKTQEKVSAAMQKHAENELALWGPPRVGDLGSRVREMKNLSGKFQELFRKHYDARTAAQLRDTPGMTNDIFDPNQVGSYVAEHSRRERNLVRRGLIGAQEGNKFPGGWMVQGGTKSSPEIYTRGFSSQSGMHSPIVGLPYYTAGAKPIIVPQQVTDLVHVPSSAGGAGGGASIGGPLSLPSGGGVPTWAKALGGLALAGGAAYGGKKLYDKYKAKQQAKEAGIIDYIPGGRNLDNAYLAYGNAKRYADAAKSGTGLANALGSNYVQGLADKYRADAIGELRTGAPKVLGTGLAVGGALYGAKKLYNHMTNNKAQEKVSAYMMKYAQEEMATSPQLPDYGRNALRGAGIGALAGGISAAGAGALGGYNLGRSFGSGGSNALITGMGAAHGGVAGALGGAGLGTLIGLGATAIQRQRIADQIAQQATAQQQAAKQAAYEFAKLAQEEEATRNLPGYGRGILRGAGKGALTGAGLGALAGGSYAMGSLAHEALVPGVHNPMRDIAFLSGAGALTGALAGTGVGALKGGIRTALQRRALAQQAKEAAALPPSLGGEIGKHLLLAGAATLGGVAVQKGLSVASAALDKLEKPKNLARMMAVAPELRAIDPQMLSLAYDSIAAISPKLVKDPLVGASVLRKHVQTTDLNALRSAADLYRSTAPTAGSLVGSALTRGAEGGFSSYQKQLAEFNKKTP